MKKKIFIVVVFCIFLSLFAINKKVNIYASEGDNILDENEIIDYLNYEEDDATVVLTNSGGGNNPSGLDFSKTIDYIEPYLRANFSDYIWHQGDGCSTKMVSNEIPINMQGALFPKSDVLEARDNAGVRSSYGGCGPIAMMGILDYFARYLGYSEIIDDPTNSGKRIRLAQDVLETVKTWEVGAVGNKDTLTAPGDYVSAFNKLIKNYGLENNIVANLNGSILLGGHEDEYMAIIEEYISKGVPVTMYMGLNTGKGDFAEHYVNIYAYENWVGISKKTGERVKKSFLKARLNFPPGDTNWDEDKFFADSEILNNGMCGIIYYDVYYDNEKLVKASEFSSQFINVDTGQGQYFNIEKSASITSGGGYAFDTKRLRCSYIENQYLVLSANRENTGQAYLEFNLHNNIKGLNFDMSLWSSTEDLTDGGSLSIQIPKVMKNGNIIWVNHIEYDIESLSVTKISPKNYNVLFPKYTSRFRFLLTKESPSGSRNKGRVVLENLLFSFNDEDNPHEHKCYFHAIDDSRHSGVCACGYESNGQHVIRAADSGGRYANCIECNKLIDLFNDFVIIIPYSNGNKLRTINGSYITSQGIIVLVDEDINDYFNGTLVFYEED